MKKLVSDLSNGDVFLFQGQEHRFIGARNEYTYYVLRIHDAQQTYVHGEYKVKVVKKQKEIVKIRVAEFEPQELFKFKGGIFEVLHMSSGSSKATCLIRKVRNKFGNKKGTPTPVGEATEFYTDQMVRRYEPTPEERKELLGELVH